MKNGRVLRLTTKVAIAFLGFSLLTMHLWNGVIVSALAAGRLSFLQAMGLLLLCRILFGGLGVVKDIGHFMARRERQAMLSNWLQMTPAERERCLVDSGFHARGGGGSGSTAERDEGGE